MLLAVGALASASCGQPPLQRAVPAAHDAGESVALDASVEDAGERAPVLRPAPALDPASITGMSAEAEQELLLSEPWRVALPMPVDGCVRVLFAAGAPIDATLGPSSVRAQAEGRLGPRGPVCERAGRTLSLSFTGHARVRYQVFRAGP